MNTLISEEKTFWQRRSHAQKSLVYALGVFGAGFMVIATLSALKPQPEPKEPEVVNAPKVEVLVAEPSADHVMVTSQGSVTPVRSIKLVSEVAGRVVNVADGYADGSFFNQDQAIVSIDSRDYEFALLQAESEVAKAKELYAIEKGRARQAKREWRDIGDKEANDLFLRKPQLAAAKASVEAAIANRDKAKLNLERTAISAPFDGRISTKHVDVGQYVTPGTVIAEVYSTESVQVRLPLTDSQVGQVSLPLTADSADLAEAPEVKLHGVYGGKSYEWKGKIVRTEGSLDIKSRVVYAVAEVEAPYVKDLETSRPPLSVGMYVSAEIIGDKLENVVKLPRKVLHQKNKIILVDNEDKVAFKEVQVLQSDGEEILVQGLIAGDRVLLTSIPYAIAGYQVDTNPEEMIADADKDALPEEEDNAVTEASNAADGTAVATAQEG